MGCLANGKALGVSAAAFTAKWIIQFSVMAQAMLTFINIL